VEPLICVIVETEIHDARSGIPVYSSVLLFLLAGARSLAALFARQLSVRLKAICGVVALAAVSGSFLLSSGQRTAPSGDTVTLTLVPPSDWIEAAAEPTFSQSVRPLKRSGAQPEAFTWQACRPLVRSALPACAERCAPAEIRAREVEIADTSFPPAGTPAHLIRLNCRRQ
jgi:hypothetical protein